MDFQKIADAVEKSSAEIKKFLFSEEIGNFLNDLAIKNNLDEETSLKLIDEVGYIILSLKERSTLKSTLAGMNIAMPAILSIISEIDKKIFSELDKVEKSNKESEKTPKQTGPVIITQETKEEALKRLNTEETKEEARERLMRRELTTDNRQPTTLQKTAEPPVNLPMVEPGEKVHEVSRQENTNPKSQITPKSSVAATGQANNVQIPKPEAEKPKLTQTPRYGYEPGKDPYREPLS